MNNVSLIGRLTADPEIKQTSNGSNYCRFTLAVKRQIKKKAGAKDTDFIDCVAWRQTADILGKYFKKGTLLGLFGKVISNEYEKDGQKIKSLEILANEIYFLEKKGEPAPEPTTEAPTMPSEPAPGIELPFEVV